MSIYRTVAGLFLFALTAGFAFAGEGGPPPAKVKVATIEAGTLSPTAEFKGTVYFKEMSDLATEVAGKVTDVLFEEGDHFSEGDTMVRQELESAKAALLQSKAQLKLEQVRLERAGTLLEDEITTEQEYDDIKYTVESYGHRASMLEAQVHRLEEQIRKKTTSAPYDGIVITRQTELGEWKREGDTVAVIARADVFDVIVNLPEQNLAYIEPGREVGITIGDRTFEGEIVAIIPKGDVATRTFPVKIRVTDQDWLLEAMSGVVEMPVGAPAECLLVPRDAVLLERGRNVAYTIRDGAAAPVPVEVIGYDGLRAGIAGDGLQEGGSIIIKGHERLREGQPVEVME